ncbi:hypothetical protein Tco_1285020 [Tanacetum coccineum]
MISRNRMTSLIAVCEGCTAMVFLGFPNSLGGNPTPTSEPFTSEFILEEIETYLKNDSISPKIDHADYNQEEDISYELELKDLPSHLEYAFLEENDKLLVIIAKGLKNDEKYALYKVLKSHKGAIAWKITDIKGDVIAKLPHPTTIKGVRSFLGHAGFYRRFIQDFSKIARPMTHLLEKETPFVFSKDCIDAFQTLKKRKLPKLLSLVVPDWNLPFEILCVASDFAISAVLGLRG